MATVPAKDAPEEEKRAAQAARAKQYGIEALSGKGESLSYPAGYPTSLDDYADPVNLKYPLSPDGRARNARARFKQDANTYSKDASKRLVHTRIVERLVSIGASPSFNPDDPLDAMLPPALKDKLQKGVAKLWGGVF